MPRTSCGLGTDEEGETADVGEPDGDEEAVSILPVLRVSCDSRVDVLLLCGVAVARERAKGGEPVDDMLQSRAGCRNANAVRLGIGWPRLELDAQPEDGNGSSLDRRLKLY